MTHHIPFARWVADKHAEAEAHALASMSPAKRHKALSARHDAKLAARKAFGQQRRDALKGVVV